MCTHVYLCVFMHMQIRVCPYTHATTCSGCCSLDVQHVRADAVHHPGPCAASAQAAAVTRSGNSVLQTHLV